MPTSETQPADPPPQQYLSDMEILSAPSPTKLSEGGHMRRRYKAHRLSKKRSVHDYSTYTDDGGESNAELQPWTSPQINVTTPIKQRSVSLTTLNNSIGQLTGASSSSLLQPRMAQLETLEAKMASIEVSLSSTSLSPAVPGVRRTKRIAPSPTPRTAPSPVSMLSVRTTPSQPTRIEVAPVTRDIETLRTALNDKENVIQSGLLNSLKSKLGPGSINSLSKGMNLRLESKSLTPVSQSERKALEVRVMKLKQEIEAKRLAVKNLKSTLDQLDITDNIDVRIRQAEVEFQLGREELNLMSLTEELRNLTTRLEIGTPQPVAPQPISNMTLFGVVTASLPSPSTMQAVLLPFCVLYDPNNPVFGISEQIYQTATVEWAREDCGLKPDDKIIEANGQILLKMKQEAFLNILKSTSLSQLKLVVLRSSPISKNSDHMEEKQTDFQDEMEKSRRIIFERAKQERDHLRAENLRLSHRISYLEEQVTDLISDTPRTPSNQQVGRAKSEVHVYQKGTHTTKIVSNGREIAVVPKPSPDRTPPVTKGRWQDESEYSDSRSTRSLDVNKYKPAPPKKPQRLSLLRTTSLQQGIDSDSSHPRKPSKRPHKNVVTVKAEPSAQWVKETPSGPYTCVLPTGAQYHNQHNMSNFDTRENWC